jgi:16S rRNA G527 N7-methylase RsmG
MISFEIDESKEGIEVYLDEKGIEELISYLNYIKKENEHMHLTGGNELNENILREGNKIIKHVKLIYSEKY